MAVRASLTAPERANRPIAQPRDAVILPWAATTANATASDPSLIAWAATQPAVGAPLRQATRVPSPIAISRAPASRASQPASRAALPSKPNALPSPAGLPIMPAPITSRVMPRAGTTDEGTGRTPGR
jgi:hypothetical protein